MMKPMAKWSRRVLVLLVLSVAGGCQPFTHEETIAMESLSVHRRNVDAPTRNQHVTVTTDSGNVPINVYIVRGGENADAVAEALKQHMEPDSSLVLASEIHTTGASVEATVPAKEPYSVFFAWPTKNTKLHYKITGR